MDNSRFNSQENQTCLLEVKGITKRFGGVVALSNVSLKLYPDEVLALLGDNGAGKSTLIKVISGAHLPDKGEVFLRGEKTNIVSPQDAKNLGIETIYQDLALFSVLDVSTNLFMGREITRSFGLLDKKRMRAQTDTILQNLKIKLESIREKVGNLSGGQQHAVAIGRAVYLSEPRIILMDEPTAGLGAKESEKVLELIKQLKEQKISIILISHNLEHVFKVADRAVVLLSGKVAGEREIKQTDRSEVVQMMLGIV
jgi:ABC-type sugar transport system ATPase subunit